jgi:hypothetical protein
MNWQLISFIVGSFILIFVVPRMWKLGEAKPREDFTVKMFGGPHDKTVQQIPYEKNAEQPPFIVSPYPPQLDDEGQPPQENIVGWMRNTLYVRPNYAYYQQISDEEYFYVRDLNEEEIVKLQQGQLPVVVQPDANE